MASFNSPRKVRAREHTCGGRGGVSAPQPECPDKRSHFPAPVFVSSPLTFLAEPSEAGGMLSAAVISCNWKRFVNISQRFGRVTPSCELQPPLLFRQKLQLSQGRCWSFPIPSFQITHLTQWDCFDIQLQPVTAETGRGPLYRRDKRGR